MTRDFTVNPEQLIAAADVLRQLADDLPASIPADQAPDDENPDSQQQMSPGLQEFTSAVKDVRLGYLAALERTNQTFADFANALTKTARSYDQADQQGTQIAVEMLKDQ